MEQIILHGLCKLKKGVKEQLSTTKKKIIYLTGSTHLGFYSPKMLTPFYL